MFSDSLWIPYAAQSPSSDVSVRAFVGTQACLLLQMTVGLVSPSCRMPSVSHVTSRAAVSSASTWASSTTCRVGSPWARVRRPLFLSPGEGGQSWGSLEGAPLPPPRYRGWGAAWGCFPQPPSLPLCTGRGLASPAVPSQLSPGLRSSLGSRWPTRTSSTSRPAFSTTLVSCLAPSLGPPCFQPCPSQQKTPGS